MYLNRLSLDVLLYLVGLFLITKLPLEKKNSVSKVILQTCAFYIQLLLQCSISE